MSLASAQSNLPRNRGLLTALVYGASVVGKNTLHAMTETLEAELFKDETAPLNKYFALPKVDLHRHLEGSLRLTTMLDIAHQHGVTVPASMFNLSGLVQVQDQDPMTFTNFLDKFKTLRLFYKSPDVIHRVTREAVDTSRGWTWEWPGVRSTSSKVSATRARTRSCTISTWSGSGDSIREDPRAGGAGAAGRFGRRVWGAIAKGTPPSGGTLVAPERLRRDPSLECGSLEGSVGSDF